MLYKFSEPYRAYLYFPYLINFKKELQGLLESFGMSHLDYTDIMLTVSETLDQIHLPDFVVRFDTWLKNQSPLDTDRYISYFKNNDNSWKSDIR
ncbi:hypothetical protein [Dickeya poaceiphila]|uniref:Uncharacterized protein n=1 Tax=Dickeya poaceiphila TaxID=568768 RepID=A0A5B8I8N2_9GAMM|nr:hypothetical protein [Dickeya poaceiphila]QDX29360.1 hypothetical protein Dpoa569_0001109 [Dickeya poaceiphila]